MSFFPPAGLPRDPAQWLALGLAVVALVTARSLVRESAHPRRFLSITALAAAALSGAYVAVYLRGGPRIIDATSYYLEARALSEGLLSFPIAAPETSVLGRFLVRNALPDGTRAAVIFPPGYPALLAVGFLARAPLALGPLLAAALVVATYQLAEAALGPTPKGALSVPRIAALLSLVCAALRYHTADTMSHGLAALCFTGALAAAFRARDADAEGRRGKALALSATAGLSAGWLLATRPPSALALALALTIGLVLLRQRSGATHLVEMALAFGAGALPGALLLLAHQHAATGSWGASSQRLYYALGDGPPDCFRYGFGAGIGCLGEHGDFVKARLGEGFGFLAAMGTTLRRLKMHLVDAANLEPLALLVPVGVFVVRRRPRGRLLGIAVLAQIAVYAPFYFDGNYPGGGARLFADVLPLEHVLLAAAVVSMANRRASADRWAAGIVALALAGFAVRAGFDHAALRDREGGRPMFAPADLDAAGVTRGLVFVDTDHGFNLGFDPAPAATIAVARGHGDALDRLTWQAHGRPPAFRHHFEIPTGSTVAQITVTPVIFSPEPSARLIEGESLWPPVAQAHGWAQPEYASGTCASAGRWLALRSENDAAKASFTVEIPGAAGRSLAPRIALGSGASGAIELIVDGAVHERWLVSRPSPRDLACERLAAVVVPGSARRVSLTIMRDPGPAALLALDSLELAGPPFSIPRDDD